MLRRAMIASAAAAVAVLLAITLVINARQRGVRELLLSPRAEGARRTMLRGLGSGEEEDSAQDWEVIFPNTRTHLLYIPDRIKGSVISSHSWSMDTSLSFQIGRLGHAHCPVVLFSRPPTPPPPAPAHLTQ